MPAAERSSATPACASMGTPSAGSTSSKRRSSGGSSRCRLAAPACERSRKPSTRKRYPRRSQQGKMAPAPGRRRRCAMCCTVKRIEGSTSGNKTRKRDSNGQKNQRARPASEWIRIKAEPLRLCQTRLDAARARHNERRDNYRPVDGSTARGSLDPRAGRQNYLLSGFTRCGLCGGSMSAVSRASSNGRRFRYICSTYWNRGSSVCANGRMAAMEVADTAIRELLVKEVLRPAVIERALDLMLHELRPRDRARERAQRQTEIKKALREVERKLENPTDAVANDGAVPAVLAALTRKDAERQALIRTALDQSDSGHSAFEPALRKQPYDAG